MGVSEKLLTVQSELKAPKSQHNDFGNFNYRSCEDILEAIKPLLQKVKAILTISDEVTCIGTRFYIKATATFQDVETGEQINISAYAREPDSRPKMDDAQATGSSSSYARKYALNGLFCIDDSKDPDATNDGQQASGRQQANRGQQGSRGQQANRSTGKAANNTGGSRLTPEYVRNLKMEADKKGVEYSAICQRYKRQTLEELTSADYVKAMSALSKMPDKEPAATPEDFQYMQQDLDFEGLPFR